MKLARLPDGSPEIFHTIQGEGRSIGMPTVFIRSSLCNLHCTWCDTPYTWNWEDTDFKTDTGKKYRRSEEIIDLPVEEIASIAKSFHCPNYVFTGGEPLLHEKKWLALMELLGDSSHFEMETNGTLLPSPTFLDQISQLNISPKLSNSLIVSEKRIKPDVLSELHKTGKADFKFVIDTEADFAEALKIIENAGISPARVFLMPRAATLVELEQRQSYVADLAKTHGFRFSDRLHIRIFGQGRGV